MVESTIRPEDRILAVDYGSRRIGLAVGSLLSGLATPLGIVDVGAAGPAASVAEIAERGRAEGVVHLLIGLPLNMNDTEGPAALAARQFGALLSAHAGWPYFFVDERLTSEAAEALRRGRGDKPRSPKKRRRVDDLAAALLLQGWLDEERARAERRKWGREAS